MKTASFTKVMNSQWGTYTVSDPWVEGLPPGLDPGPPWGTNGLISLSTPSRGTIVTGTKYGPVRLTVEVHDERISGSGIGDVWSDIVELSFEIRSGRFAVIDCTANLSTPWRIYRSGGIASVSMPVAGTRGPPASGTLTPRSRRRSICSNSFRARSSSLAQS